MKEPKLLLVGPPDSGKTSWVAPFEGEWDTLGAEHYHFEIWKIKYKIDVYK